MNLPFGVRSEGIESPLNDKICTANPPLTSSIPNLPDRSTPTFVHYDSFTGTTYFNDTSAVGGIIPTTIREPRLAIEGDIHISNFPSASSCLSRFQFLPNDVYCGLEAKADNIDE